MNTKFDNVKIDQLTESERIELLCKIEELVADMPSLTVDAPGHIFDEYACCGGATNHGHDKNCSIGQLRKIFGY